MKDADARLLSNAYQDVHLYSLHTWPDAGALQSTPGQGPYVVLQTAIDPQSLGATVEDFILGRNGRWLPLVSFRRLPQELRREMFVFSAASGVIEVLQGLTGTPTVERGQPEASDAAETSGDDPLNRAVAEACQRGAIPNP